MLRNSVFSTSKPKTDFAKKLRQNMTPGEVKLWSKLRAARLHGFKFRRQVPIGPYVVDFLCVEKMLIIEVDGDAHFEPGAIRRDNVREQYLRKQGFDILHILNSTVVCDVNTAIVCIERKLGHMSI